MILLPDWNYAFGQTTQTFTSNGIFTVPVGVTEITVKLWCGLGDGGDASGNNAGAGGGGSAGAGNGGSGATGDVRFTYTNASSGAISGTSINSDTVLLLSDVTVVMSGDASGTLTAGVNNVFSFNT